MGRVFWLGVGLLVAIATYISYVLFAPPLLFQRALAAQTRDLPQNQSFVLAPEAQMALFPAYPASSVVVLCKYDVSAGPVTVTAHMPFGYWTLTGYGRDGKQFYSLTDEQAGTNSITMRIVPRLSLLEQMLGSGGEGESLTAAGWQVTTPQKSGLAVLWAPVDDPMQRPLAVEIMAHSRCGPVPKS